MSDLQAFISEDLQKAIAAESDLEPPPCRCLDSGDCQCLCDHGKSVVDYQEAQDPERDAPDGIASDGCIALCRCGGGTCYCDGFDFDVPDGFFPGPAASFERAYDQGGV